MCGIVGYTGSRPAAPLLLEGLSRLEYRGYDSSGLAVRDGDNPAQLVRACGRLSVLKSKIAAGAALSGCCGIGHTRWATHGAPSLENAHPHCSDDRAVIAVHNGIIENYQDLRDKLTRAGYSFYSQTDTEAAVKLIHYYLCKYRQGPIDALSRAMARMRGSYALAVMFALYPDEIYAARKDSPLIVGAQAGECFLASDVPAILPHTRSVYYIGDLEIARLCKGEAAFFNMDREPVQKSPVQIGWNVQSAEKAGFEHFMMKEIHEQPQAVRATLDALIANGRLSLCSAGLTDAQLRDISRIVIIACGSAYHVGMAAQYVIETLARIPVRVEIASEFRYRQPLMDARTLAVVISQSGETADSLAALRTARALGACTLGIVNVSGSSIAREADHVLYTQAGPEIAVATTKAYSTQLIACYALAMQLAFVRGTLPQARYDALLQALHALPQQIEQVLSQKDALQWFAAKFSGAHNMFFIGRGLDYAISLEGSLKMKEITYIHSEAYAAGELKHGTISLIEPGTLVIGIATQQKLYEKTLSNMQEVKSRGAYLMGLTQSGHHAMEKQADYTLYIPPTDPLFAASLAVIPLQLMAYYTSVAKGLDVDKPRNLAKSVTVE